MQNKNSSRTKRVAIAIIGGTVVLFGIVLIVFPGPAFIVIPAGLAILATEFAWAARWLHKAKEYYKKQRNKFKRQDALDPGKLK
jgi:tellurite resistance protein TerC